MRTAVRFTRGGLNPVNVVGRCRTDNVQAGVEVIGVDGVNLVINGKLRGIDL